MHKVLLPFLMSASIAIPVCAQNIASPSSYAATATQTHAEQGALASLTLAAALDLAFNANPEIAIARREVEATAGTVQQAGLIPNPELETLIEDTKRETRTTTVQINQAIELGGKRGARITAAERGRDFALMELKGKQADIRATVIAAFYDVVIAQERHRLAQASFELAQRATLGASRRVIAGKISPVEETRARVAESGVRIELAQANNELESARRKLAATWGSSHPRFERVEDPHAELPALIPLPELTERLQHSPVLQRAKIEVERRAAMAQVERSRQTPDVMLSLGAKRDEQMGRNQAVIGVSIPLPVFDRNQGNVLEALRRTDKARDELLATEVNLNMELGDAHGRLSIARMETQLIKNEILPGAKRNYEASSKGFELGKFSFLEVLDAQRTFFQAESQYLRSLAETYRAAAAIDRLLGEPFSAIK
ncbi:MAG: TolC family protein [Herminiimonas sp.]|uniref:TolC family protein n=1 Tax=Herminiimonas sp. TaxID=1926289 RepID=UPI00271BC1F9|nr:TolC family protein [Herminiimonas sp.]MDO9420966.1 TolC family protein [Herminiimonas sp.]